MLRIGVTDAGVGEDGAGAALDIQDLFTVPVGELQQLSRGTLPANFGPVVSEDGPTA